MIISHKESHIVINEDGSMADQAANHLHSKGFYTGTSSLSAIIGTKNWFNEDKM